MTNGRESGKDFLNTQYHILPIRPMQNGVMHSVTVKW